MAQDGIRIVVETAADKKILIIFMEVKEVRQLLNINQNKGRDMKKKDGRVLREVCGEKVLVGEGLGAVDFGRLISLNDTAAYLWEQLDENPDVDSLTQALCKEYEVDTKVARHDVEAVLEEWIKAGIVER